MDAVPVSVEEKSTSRKQLRTEANTAFAELSVKESSSHSAVARYRIWESSEEVFSLPYAMLSYVPIAAEPCTILPTEGNSPAP